MTWNLDWCCDPERDNCCQHHISNRVEISILFFYDNLFLTLYWCQTLWFSLSLSLQYVALFLLLCILYKRPMSTTSKLSLIEMHLFDTHRCFTWRAVHNSGNLGPNSFWVINFANLHRFGRIDWITSLAFDKASDKLELTRHLAEILLNFFHSDTTAAILNGLYQGSLTEGEGSVRLTSSLK
jgi:hypothetical protein